MMADAPRLDNPHVLVVMADGTEHDVQTESPDMVLFDLERARRKWPPIQEAPFLWLSYLAFSKLKRSGVEVGRSFEEWMLKTSKVQNLDTSGDESDETAQAFPTPTAPEPG